ncbi:MAG: hypothetical protein NT062_24130 [Proteobacteria bacterium]|nr:hypothetical protein [Pseudomonadota bacterium]
MAAGMRATIWCGLLAPTLAWADAPTTREYAIELYDGAALGNAATIAMGGAAVANAIGSAGTLVNPSAMAVRPTTDTDAWSWDYHLDAVSSSLSSDVDNNGRSDAHVGGTSALTAGLGIRYHDWALAVTGTYQTAPLVGSTVPIGAGAAQRDVALDGQTTRSIVSLSKYVPQIDVAFGASLDLAKFEITPDCSDAGCDTLFAISAGGVGLGATWMPSLTNVRVGSSLRSTFRGGQVDANARGCDPMDCLGYVLPRTVVSPWRFASGIAYRWADTAWNQLVGGLFRDERSLTVVADLVVTGASTDAFGLEDFGLHELHATGRHVAVSPRAGAELEWLPGRLRVRAGSYWEPARFDDVNGRVHATFGVEGRVFEVHLLGLRRGRITLTGDVARRYSNVGVSVGFWH